MLSKNVEKLEVECFVHCGKNENCAAAMETASQLKTKLLSSPAIPLLGGISQESKVEEKFVNLCPQQYYS